MGTGRRQSGWSRAALSGARCADPASPPAMARRPGSSSPATYYASGSSQVLLTLGNAPPRRSAVASELYLLGVKSGVQAQRSLPMRWGEPAHPQLPDEVFDNSITAARRAPSQFGPMEGNVHEWNGTEEGAQRPPAADDRHWWRDRRGLVRRL